MTQHTQPGGKVEQVLTDQEIVGLSLDLASVLGASAFVETVRKVEAAVLAKINWNFVKERKTKPIYEMHPADATREAKQALEDAGYVVVLRSTVLPQFNVVTEREVQLRELMAKRAAYAFGWLDNEKMPPDGLTERQMQVRMEARYPLPTTRVPRTVVLSDGVRVRKNLAGEGWDHFHDGTRMLRFLTLGDLFSLAGTVADARLLADLVERPYDEVPDGEG